MLSKINNLDKSEIQFRLPPASSKRDRVPKKEGKMRKLGIPTLRDRIAQQVVKGFMEVRIDSSFS